jgi:UDP-glucose 4-epimerase
MIHLAAMHFIPDCIAHPDKTMAVNVEGTRCVLDCCRGRPLRHVAFASSAAVYAPGDSACVEAGTPLGPLEVYGKSKVAGEQLAARFQEQTGISTSILRFFNAIGRHETNPHVVPHIFESLRRSDSIELGSTAPRRDYIDTRDIADAIVVVADRAEPLTIYNVGTGAAYSVDEVVDALRRILARPITVVREASRVRTTERMVLLADIGSIRQATGWQPRYSLDDTLRDLVAAYSL